MLLHPCWLLCHKYAWVCTASLKDCKCLRDKIIPVSYFPSFITCSKSGPKPQNARYQTVDLLLRVIKTERMSSPMFEKCFADWKQTQTHLILTLAEWGCYLHFLMKKLMFREVQQFTCKHYNQDLYIVIFIPDPQLMFPSCLGPELTSQWAD